MKMFSQLLTSDPFEFTSANKELFVKSFRENALHHYHSHDFTRKFWDHLNFHPDQIQAEDDQRRRTVGGCYVRLWIQHLLIK